MNDEEHINETLLEPINDINNDNDIIDNELLLSNDDIKEENENNDYSNYKCLLFNSYRSKIIYCVLSIASCLFIIALILFLIPYFINMDNSNYNSYDFGPFVQNAGVVIDLGSSGSRVTVFGWGDNYTVQYIPFGGPLFFHDAIGKGITSYDTPQLAAESLDPLLSYAERSLFSVNIKDKDTPLYIYGTGGLRSIPIEESNAILQSISEFVQENYNFILNDDWIGILSGQEEALYDWITVQQNQLICNEQNQTFPYIYPFDYLYDNSIIENMGIMDMGGSSLEISFIPDYIPDRNDNIDNTTFSNIQYQNRTYAIYTVSYPDLGHGSAWKTHTKILIQEHIDSGDDTQNIYDPCLPINAAQKVKNPISSDPPKYYFHGTGDPQACTIILESIINSSFCEYNNCGAEGIYQPFVNDSPFIGFSQFAYVANYFGCFEDCTIQYLHELVTEFCLSDWDIITENSGNMPLAILIQYCYGGLYITTLLTSGFGFDVESTQINFIEFIYYNVELSWALGLMTHIQETGTIR